MRILLTVLLFLPFLLPAQELENKLSGLERDIAALEAQKIDLLGKVELVKFDIIQRDLDAVGLPNTMPGDEVVRHSAMVLAYCEEHEQARWVAHIIPNDVLGGTVTRSNDFRPDPLVSTGTAVEEDYFLKFLQTDSTYQYDGFGYDRGHLAPSADFRWSEKALSESYYYSNMSPQRAELNREAWGELENKIRGYLYGDPETKLYVVTGPVLKDGLPVVERGVNKVSIPEQYWKVVLDLKNERAIGFVLPNQKVENTLQSYAVTIDEVEQITGLDFFSKLDDKLEDRLESQLQPGDWLPEVAAGDVEPLYPPDLPRNHFNTTQARQYQNKDDVINVCGKVVSARRSRAGNILMNLDKQFPNQVFTVFIRKQNIANFSYDPEQALKGKTVCAKGRVVSLSGVSAMFIEGENELKVW